MRGNRRNAQVIAMTLSPAFCGIEGDVAIAVGRLVTYKIYGNVISCMAEEMIKILILLDFGSAGTRKKPGLWAS